MGLNGDICSVQFGVTLTKHPKGLPVNLGIVISFCFTFLLSLHFQCTWGHRFVISKSFACRVSLVSPKVISEEVWDGKE